MPLDFTKGFFMHSKVLIIGAGLTGLTLAYQLKKAGVDFQILEARERLGGRIFTKMSGNHIPVDLGAAWFWEYNPQLRKLLAELHIQSFPQQMGTEAWYEPQPNGTFKNVQIPPQQQISYRINGGTTHLILSLAGLVNHDNIKLNTMVSQVSYKNSEYTVQSNNGIFNADLVVTTLPPALNTQIIYDPVLPSKYLEIAKNTHTWMQDSVKFGLGFKTAFWKELNIPVTAFSNFSVISEMYDYSNITGDRFGIMGFLNPQLIAFNKEERKIKVLDLLTHFLGKPVMDFVSYEDCSWSEEPFTKLINGKSLPPHHNNGNPRLRSTFHNHSLIMAGSETSAVLPGYMEGAVNSAIEAFQMIKKQV